MYGACTRDDEATAAAPRQDDATAVWAEDGAGKDRVCLTTAAGADDTAPSGAAIASMAVNTISSGQREDRPARTANLSTARPP